MTGILGSQIALSNAGRASSIQRGANSPSFKDSVCPTVLRAFFRMFLAALTSLSSQYPHEQTWVLVDRDFVTFFPQLEQSAEVLWGATGIVSFPYFIPKYSNQ
jgi:hypothetical protein